MFFDEIEQLSGSTIENFDINKYGSAVRNHPDFAPLGANANFIRIQSDDDGNYIRIRTFERGVEGETPACGTGCMSSAITAYGLGRIRSMPIRLKVQSGEFVTVGFEVMEDRVRDLWLEGSARRLRSGILSVAEE
jgi:diaminopimelate epimerase